MASVKSILENATNIALLVICSLLMWQFAARYNLRAHNSSAPGHNVSLDGKSLNAFSDYKWSDHYKTLLLGLKVGCRYCEANMSFYKQLSDLSRAHKLKATPLVFMPDSKESAIQLLKSNDINIDGIYAHPLSSVQIYGTPTLMLVDSHGRVEKAWVGQLAPSDEEQVVSMADK